MPRKNTLTVEGVTDAMRELFAFDPVSCHLMVRHDLMARWAGTTQQMTIEHRVDIIAKRGRRWLVRDAIRRIRRRAAAAFMENFAQLGVARAALTRLPKPYGEEIPDFGIPEYLRQRAER